MKLISLKEELVSNAYPGRGIVIGKSADGKKAVTNAPVCNQSLYKFSIDSASWIIYDLPEFKLIVCHGWPPS